MVWQPVSRRLPKHFHDPSLQALGNYVADPFRMRTIFPHPFLSASTSKLTERKNITSYVCCLTPDGPPDKENQVKMYKKYRFRYIIFLKQ
jgi:hypothetical protein